MGDKIKLQFNSELDYQIAAIESTVNLFNGQGSDVSYFTFSGQQSLDSQYGIANKLNLRKDDLLKNLEDVQNTNQIHSDWDFSEGYNFTIEMETGTGKTYVYLRSIFELNKKYGFTKFVIVVPSLAIKEGVYKSLQITEDHFKTLYNNIVYDYFQYDSQKLGLIRNFSVSSNIEIMVINIDSFIKSFDNPKEEDKANIINRPNDKLNGLRPIDLIKETNPVVIIDEPQSTASTDLQKKAIRNLNPLCTLQYSATPKNKKNLIYKLNAVDAYEKDLVKEIEVASLQYEDDFNSPYIKLMDIQVKKSKITARVEVDKKRKNGLHPIKYVVSVKKGDTLSSDKLAGRDIYDDFKVEVIDSINGFIKFYNGVTIELGQCINGVDGDLLKRQQIHTTIKHHLDKELVLNDLGIKVLSLFFIDRVANYRDDSSGERKEGKYYKMFEEEYEKLINQPEYQDLSPNILNTPVSEVHGGYFSQDNKNNFIETKGVGEEKLAKHDKYKDSFDLIMRNKEKLLSFDEPLRFIFSHSALREGWDNPNVFQICTLNETASTMKKRQEIGRGLRLPVDQTGERIHKKNINILTVVANESYDSFARSLQQEMEEDGFKFGIINEYAFEFLEYENSQGKIIKVGKGGSQSIVACFRRHNYIDNKGKILEPLKIAIEKNFIEVPERYESIRDKILEEIKKPTEMAPIKKARERKPVTIDYDVFYSKEFLRLWNKLKYKTTYQIDFDSEKLIENCCKAMKHEINVQLPKIVYTVSGLEIDTGGVKTIETFRDIINVQKEEIALPDIITYLQNETFLTRKTIIQILIKSETLDQFKLNPQEYMDSVVRIIARELNILVIDGVKYKKLDETFKESVLENDELFGYVGTNIFKSNGKSLYDYVFYDSEIEKDFAKKLENDKQSVSFLKLPSDFKIPTPAGFYNPDWGIVLKNDKFSKTEDGENEFSFVIETKGTTDSFNRRQSENAKIECGRKSVEALGGVYYDVADSYNTFKQRASSKYLNK